MDSSAAPRFTRILLTGPPGIGKTTICKKLVSLLVETKCCVDGFYTEEVRSMDKKRIGFDIVSLRNNRERRPLARIGEHLGGRQASTARVGNYHVFVSEFETMALPVFNSRSDILFIDEIGKMELFSTKFKENIAKFFFSPPKGKPVCVIATIPQKEKIPQRFVHFFDRLRDDDASKVIEVDRVNRNDLPDLIKAIIST